MDLPFEGFLKSRTDKVLHFLKDFESLGLYNCRRGSKADLSYFPGRGLRLSYFSTKKRILIFLEKGLSSEREETLLL